MTNIKKYLSLVKFSHTIFAMPFALIGFFLGNSIIGSSVKSPQAPAESAAGYGFVEQAYLYKKFFLVILCMVTARSAAMAFNRYLDSNFDARNARTAIREIPAGIIS